MFTGQNVQNTKWNSQGKINIKRMSNPCTTEDVEIWDRNYVVFILWCISFCSLIVVQVLPHCCNSIRIETCAMLSWSSFAIQLPVSSLIKFINKIQRQYFWCSQLAFNIFYSYNSLCVMPDVCVSENIPETLWMSMFYVWGK